MISTYISFLSGLVLILTLSTAGCKKNGKTVKEHNYDSPNDKEEVAAPDPVFFKCWAHAFEQDSVDGTKLFLSCMNHTFPVARYRQSFTLNKDGKVEYTVLGENDAHRTENGMWSYDAGTRKLRISDKGNSVVEEYEVLEVNDDLLRLK